MRDLAEAFNGITQKRDISRVTAEPPEDSAKIIGRVK